MLRDLRVNRIEPPRAMTRRCGLPGGRRRKPARPRAPPAGHEPLLAPLRAPALPAPDIHRLSSGPAGLRGAPDDEARTARGHAMTGAWLGAPGRKRTRMRTQGTRPRYRPAGHPTMAPPGRTRRAKDMPIFTQCGPDAAVHPGITRRLHRVVPGSARVYERVAVVGPAALKGKTQGAAGSHPKGARVEPHRLHDIPRTSGSRWLPSGRGPCFAPRLELRARCPETAADHPGPALDRPALGRSAGRVRPSGGGSRE